MSTKLYKFNYETPYGHPYVAATTLGLWPGCADCGFHEKEHLIHTERIKMDHAPSLPPNKEDIATFKSGAVRSEKAPPWFMLPWEAIRVILERFNIGAIIKGYGIHNWKKAIGTGDLDFIRQLFDHVETHWIHFVTNVGTWRVDSEGKHANETPMDHLAAVGWGVLALITYILYDRENVMRAFNQWPESWTLRGPGEPYRHPPTNEFELRDHHWTPIGRPEEPRA